MAGGRKTINPNYNKPSDDGYFSKYKKQRQAVQDYFKKGRAPGSEDYKPTDTSISPYKKSPDLSVKGDSGKIKPAQNKVTPAVSDNIIPSHLKNSNATTQEPKYPLRVTAADKGGLQVKSPSANDNVVTGNLSTKKIDMHQQARNMINRPTSVEEMNKRRK